MGWGCGGPSPGNRILLAFCFWWRSSVLLGQWSWSKMVTKEDSIFTPKRPAIDFSHLLFAKIPLSTFIS